MRLEVRIPISPRPAWLNRVRLIAKSIRQWYPDAIVCASVTPEARPITLPLPNEDIEWFAVDRELYPEWEGTRSPYLPTMMARYDARNVPFTGDVILMLDADVLPIRRFDELLDVRAIQGVMAHHSPYTTSGWDRLFRGFGLPPPRHVNQYSAWGVMEFREPERYGPFYPNSGMVIGPRLLFEHLSSYFFEAIKFLRANLADTYWFDQAGFTLGMAAAGVPYRTLPLRYNFPNRPAFDRAFPRELADVRFLHAMQTDVVDRDRDFETREAIEALVSRRDLLGSNEVLRKRIQELPAWRLSRVVI